LLFSLAELNHSNTTTGIRRPSQTDHGIRKVLNERNRTPHHIPRDHKQQITSQRKGTQSTIRRSDLVSICRNHDYHMGNLRWHLPSLIRTTYPPKTTSRTGSCNSRSIKDSTASETRITPLPQRRRARESPPLLRSHEPSCENRPRTYEIHQQIIRPNMDHTSRHTLQLYISPPPLRSLDLPPAE
jgi:hypothetical protein